MNGPATVKRFAAFQKDLASLKRAFAETPQQKGGRRALSGFVYQMQAALLALLKAWTANPGHFKSNQDLAPLLVETLSDYTELSTAAIVCCQVKRTLRPTTTRQALEEFWLILQIAKDQKLRVADALRFRIVHRFRELEDFDKTIASWAPSERSNKSTLKRFKESIDIINEPDPAGAILALLANKFASSEPLEQLHDWLSALFRAAENGGDFSQALEKIWSDLRGLENSSHARSSPRYLWSSEDQPPQAVKTGLVRVGGRATVNDLREGYFADRIVFQELTDKAADWIEKTEVSRDAVRKLNLFWIVGRSGTGKSVALLHVLARLHSQENDRTIIWLGNDVTALPECFRWARPLLQSGRQVIIGLDDPFPADRESDLAGILTSARQELIGLQHSQQETRCPLIVCCGPTEQWLGFRRQFDGMAAVTPANLPKESSKDRAALWDWYQRRTGVEVPQPYTPEQDVLLVQLFFEWQTGLPIGDFASSFRQRIRRLDQTPERSFERFMDLLFAINRLYVNYPVELLRTDRRLPAFETAFRLLHEEESHLTVEEDSGQMGVRITHPHLANAIYESPSWYPREPYYEPERRSHLLAILSRSLESCTQPRDKVGVLWAIARLSDPNTEESIRSRLDPTMVASLLRDVTEKMRDGSVALPVYVLPVLVELQARYPFGEFAFSPLRAACDVLERQALNNTGFRLLCHKILQHREALHRLDAAAMTHAVQAIRSVLRDQLTWAEWPHVALDYKKTTADDTIDPWIAAWIKSHLEHSKTPAFIQDIVEVAQSEDVAAAALTWLNTVGKNSATAPFVLQALLENYKDDDSLRLYASRWLDEHDHNLDPWTYVWEDLARAVPPEDALREHVLTIGRNWLNTNSQRDQHPSWPGVLALLIELSPADADLRQRGWDWQAAANIDHGAWTFLWEALEKATRQDWEHRDKLISVGVRWLNENQHGERHGAWPGVLARLILSRPGDRDLRESGWKWLGSAGIKHRSWAWVWQSLECTTQNNHWPHRKELLEDGIKWLISAPVDSPQWQKVFNPLVRQPAEISTGMDKVYQSGRKWIDFHDRNSRSRPSNWPNVIASLVNWSPKERSLCDTAWNWLKHVDLTDTAALTLWSVLFDATDQNWPHRELLFSFGKRWLAAHLHDYELLSWPSVALRVVRTYPKEPRMREAAWKWLESAHVEHDLAWPGVWDALYHTEPDASGKIPQLRELGWKWLRTTDQEHGSWGRTWENVFKLGEIDAAFLDAGFHWAANRIGQLMPSFILPKLLSMDSRYEVFIQDLIAWLIHSEPSSELWFDKLIILLNTFELCERRIDEAMYLRASASLTALNHAHPLWGPIWVSLYDQRSADGELELKAMSWVQTGQISLAWASVWLRLTSGLRESEDLVIPAINWLTVTRVTHNKWLEVWKRLWDWTADCENLGPLATGWLRKYRHRKEQTAWNEIWSLLWDAGYARTELERLKE